MDNIKNELTKEEVEKMDISQLLEALAKEPKVIRIEDDILCKRIKKLIKDNDSVLSGELDFYCVYQKPCGSTIRYALVHGFYYEVDGVTPENIRQVSFEDAKLIHAKLKETDIQLDYFFIMPYYEPVDRSKSFLANDSIWETNELE